jgi:hypothetical protein
MTDSEDLAGITFSYRCRKSKASHVMLNIPSIKILMNKICIAFKGLLSPNMVLSVMSVNAAAAVLNWNDRKFWIL